MAPHGATMESTTRDDDAVRPEVGDLNALSEVDLRNASDNSALHTEMCLSYHMPHESQSAPTTPMAARREVVPVTTTVAAPPDNGKSDSSCASGYMAATRKTHYRNPFNLYEGFFACFRPVISYFGRSQDNLRVDQLMRSTKQISTANAWEIDFSTIKDLEWLGSGSQGAVFSGHWNGAQVAVKKVKEAAEVEIEHLHHLDHPNVIKFLGVCKQSPVYAIVMEYCERGPMSETLRKNDRIEWTQWTSWAEQIASAMNYLHNQKVIHRDLKSPNILMKADNTLRICDFGTSQMQKKMNSTEMSFCGTVMFVAPEMIKKEPCSEKVDIWSYGVVLWEMLTREQPYKNIDPRAVLFGVGNNQLSLPIPQTAPEGLKLLIKQCWSQKPRNRPSFTNILAHLDILKKELEALGEELWQKRCDMWRREAANIVYAVKDRSTVENVKAEAENLRRKREDELKHAKDIREMYEVKFVRVNKMYAQLTNCLAQVHQREQELERREHLLQERLVQEGLIRPARGGSFTALQKQRPVVVRAGPKTLMGQFEQDVFCTSIATEQCYGGEKYFLSSSSEDEQVLPYARGSPYRCSQASSSSGYVPSSASVNFSRQNSARSSGLAFASSAVPPPAKTRGSGAFSREHTARHSAPMYPPFDVVRASPARSSVFSDDLAPTTIYRNADGRWSDGRLVQRRRRPKSFVRDSPARLPHVRPRDSSKRSSVEDSPASRASRRPSSHYDTTADYNTDAVAAEMRKMRARSMIVQQSPSHPGQLRAHHTVEPEPLKELSTIHLPTSSSYDEALRSRAVSSECASRQMSVDECQCEYSNPLYQSPVSTFENPLMAESLKKDDSVENDDDDEMAIVVALGNDVDLQSSLDSNSHVAPNDNRRASDASAESNDDNDEDDGANGNLFESSLDSSTGAAAFCGISTEEEIRRRHHDDPLTSSIASTMAASLERSLEQGALHSDGLSDQERNVRAVKHSIMGHRRTHSNPMYDGMAVVHEYMTESDEDAVKC